MNYDADMDAKLFIDSWKVDQGTREQIKHVAQLPGVYGKAALMPDCHNGYGVPIGCVFGTQGVVYPSAVGVDIGCGVRLALIDVDPASVTEEQLKRIASSIRMKVPLGRDVHTAEDEWKRSGREDAWDSIISGATPSINLVGRDQMSLGTLGGGNHFIEIQRAGNRMGVMIHSGSRNLGHRTATYHIGVAKGLNEKWRTPIPSSWGLPMLPTGSDEGRSYLADMEMCLTFARINRLYILMACLEAVGEEVGAFRDGAEVVDVHHNYAAMENHFGKNLLIHRKGAVRARATDTVLIPGSQGTASYVGKGLGNLDSFKSCSHGAGRQMSRSKARDVLDLQETIDGMNATGVIHSVRTRSDLDEAPGAYKDIEEVMEDQAELVKPIVRLTPMLVIKG